MTKLTLDMNTFKALASDTRLDILRALDGKKLNLSDLCRATNLNKATLHEHLAKLNEAGLVKKKEREGHKWVYYRLTWKGEGLLHPENTRIVVLFTTTFLTLFLGVVMLVNYVKGYIVGKAVNFIGSDSTYLYEAESSGIRLIPEVDQQFSQAPIANVPLKNQTISTLTDTFLDQSNSKGVLGNIIKSKDLSWANVNFNNTNTTYGLEDVLDKGGENVAEQTGNSLCNVPSQMIAIVHDPALQYIAIACIIIFSILLSIGIWRLYKNKKSKL
jgi:DNA-binding transcriptional ArsR family regulator